MIKDKTIIDKIEQALEKIRPYLNDDGGDYRNRRVLLIRSLSISHYFIF